MKSTFKSNEIWYNPEEFSNTAEQQQIISHQVYYIMFACDDMYMIGYRLY